MRLGIFFTGTKYAIWTLVCWWWRFDWSFARRTAPVVITASIILSSNKIQNGDILVPANLLTQVHLEMAVKTDRNRERKRITVKEKELPLTRNTYCANATYLSDRRDPHYSLRERSHYKSLITKSSELSERDILIRMLYKDCYWHFNFRILYFIYYSLLGWVWQLLINEHVCMYTAERERERERERCLAGTGIPAQISVVFPPTGSRPQSGRKRVSK